METGRHAIWFERPVGAELVDVVGPEVAQLGPGTRADPYSGIGSARGVVASLLDYNGAVMDRAPQLRVIGRTGIGYDRVDIAAATARGILVCNTPDGPTVSTAEHAVMLLIMASKNVVRSMKALRAGESDLYAGNRALELDGKNLGLVGFGRIARRVARVAQGLGMTVTAHDPYLGDGSFSVARASSLEELLSGSDVVSVHVPLTPESRQMFDEVTFSQMRPGSVFVNTARGGLVDHDALQAALDSGHLFGAGLDVTDPEPLPLDHPLLAREDVVVTPHVASGTFASRRRIFAATLDQVVDALDGIRPPHVVNPEVLEGTEPPIEKTLVEPEVSDTAAATLSPGKIRGLEATSTDGGVFTILAIDHRDSMRAVLQPDDPEGLAAETLTEAKLWLLRELGGEATAVVLDPEYSAAQAIATRSLPGHVGFLVAVEAQGYLGDPDARKTPLLDDWGVGKAKRLGASGIKLLVLYRPDSAAADEQDEVISRVVADCVEHDIPLFLEPIAYRNSSAKNPAEELAMKRRAIVVETVQRLSALGPDILKVQFPVDTAYQTDQRIWADACAELDEAASVPWALLSGGDPYVAFRDQVGVACEAGASGFIVGRALWGDLVLSTPEERRDLLDSVVRPRFRELSAIARANGRDWGLRHQSPTIDQHWYKRY